MSIISSFTIKGLVIICSISSKKEPCGQTQDICDSQGTTEHKKELGKTLSHISSMFADHSLDIDLSIDKCLEKIGMLSGASRSYVFLICKGGIMDNTHEWCSRGVEPQRDNLQGLPIDMFPWWMGKLYNGEIIHIKDVSSLPPEAVAEKQTLEMQDIRSLLVLPIFSHKGLEGFIGLDNVVDTGQWSTDEISLLSMVSHMVGTALQRRMVENSLVEAENKYRLIFEKSPIGIFHFDQDGLVTHCNERFAQICTISRGSIIGSNVFTLLPDEQLKEGIRSIISGDSDRYCGEYREGSGDGVAPVKIDLSPYIAEDGSFLGGIGIVEGISHKIEAERLNERKLELEQALSLLSSMFVDPDNMDHAIDASLKKIGELCGCNRSFVIQFNGERSMMDCTHEWVNGDFEPYIDDLKNLATFMFPWLIANLRGEKMIYIKNVSSLPELAHTEKKLFRDLGISSLIAFPIYVGEDMEGFIAMSNAAGKRNWQQDAFYVLRMVSNLLGMSLGVKMALQALKGSQEKYSTLVEKSEDGIVIIQNGVIKFANEKLARIMEHSRDELLGKALADLIADGCRGVVSEKHGNGIEAGRTIPHKYEVYLLSGSGKEVPVEVNVSFVEYNGRPADMAILRDITERKHYEGELKRANKYLDQLIKASPVSILSIDASQNVVTANNSALEMLGYGNDEIVGNSISELLFNGVTIEHMDRKDFELDFVHRDGKKLPMNVSTSVMGDGLVLTLQDMSQLRGLFIYPLREDPVDDTPEVGDSLDLESGCVYIIDDEDLEMSYGVFSDLVRSGWSGLCITRQNPQRIRDIHGLSKTPFVWLTKNQVKDQLSIAPGELFKLHPTITNFIGGVEKGLVLLDGLEYLILENDFKAVMKFVEQTNDAVMASGSTLLIQVDPDVFDRKEYHLLKRWMKPLPGDGD